MINTTASIPETIKVTYERAMLMRALPLLLHLLFGQKGTIPAGGGMSTEWRKWGVIPVSTTPLTQGVTPLAASMSMTKIEATAEQFGKHVEGTDLLDLTSFDPVIADSSVLLGENAGDTLDQVARDVLHGGTNVFYAGGRTARNQIQAGDVWTSSDLRKCIRILTLNKARKVDATIDQRKVAGNGGAWVVLHDPSTTFDIQADPKWEAAQAARAAAGGVSGLIDGNTGGFYGCEFFESTNTKVFPGAGAGGAVDVHSTLIIGANAYGVRWLQALEMILHQAGSGGTSDPLNQRWTNAWKAAFVAKILQQLFMIRYEHAVSN